MADRPKKLLFACVMLVAGVGGAMLFRRSPINREIPDEAQFGGLVLQAIDPSVRLPVPPLPPDPLPGSQPPDSSASHETVPKPTFGEPVPATPAPPMAAPQASEPAPTPHLLGSIELTETLTKPSFLTPVTTRTAR